MNTCIYSGFDISMIIIAISIAIYIICLGIRKVIDPSNPED